MTARDFEATFKRLYLPLGMYALRIVENADDAEDLVEESFMKIWEMTENGHQFSNIDALCYRIVRNNCISFLRKKHESVGLENIPDVNDETVDTSLRDAKIWKAIDSLPEKCREIFLMSKRDGMTNAEIAEELGISVKTVKNQMTKAFDRLRKELANGYRPFFLPFL